MAPRAAILSAFLLLGCFPPGEGAAPPLSKVYFPVGLAVDEDEKFLFIVNSDFDLQYNAGTVQSWDLAQLRKRVPLYCESNADCERLEPFGDLRTQCSPVAGWCVRPGFSPCGLFGEQNSRERSLYPGPCGPISQTVPQDGGPAILPLGPDDMVEPGRAVVIGAFATDVVRKKPVAPPGWKLMWKGDEQLPDPPPERLFIPVRGDATLHWIDIDPTNGKLECGQRSRDDGACDDDHRMGDSPAEENTRNGARLEPEPFGLDADENGMNLIVSNQTSGAVSLFSHRRTIVNGESTIQWGEGPQYQFREGGMPRRPMGVANVPMPLAMPSSGRERLPGFLVSFRDAAVVFLIRVYDDAAADPARPYTRRYESERIETNSSGIDSRGIGVDAMARQAHEGQCLERFGISRECALYPDDPKNPACAAANDPAFQECLASAAATPLDVFMANRTPSSLVLGRTQAITSDSVTSDIPQFYSQLPLDVGPSRVFVGDIINRAGVRERRVFVLCFDSRRIAIYDPKTGELEAEVVTGRGPHAFALDVQTAAEVEELDAEDNVLGNNGPYVDHAFAYVGHFLDSYVGVIDLDQRHRGLYGTIIANVGKPVPPRASK